MGVLSAASASATLISNQVYDFSGTCSDCTGTATAELTLTGDYTLGSTLSSSNFISFHYDGTNLVSAFTILPSDSGFFVSGFLNTVPGSDNVEIENANALFQFRRAG